MGNVHASSQQDPTTSNIGFPSMPEVQKQTSKETETIENPGTMEDLHKACKDVFPVNFEGAKINVQKGLSNHFQVSHSLNMSSLTPSGYRFGATYVGTKQFGPSECFPVLIGDVDPSGNLNANIFHKFTDRIMTKFQAQIMSGKVSGAQFITDYKGDTYTVSATVANPNVVDSSGVFVAHYLQSITKKLALGAELAYQRNNQIPGGQVAFVSLAGRYCGEDYTMSGTLGVSGVHFCYHQKASDQIQVSVELETNLRMQEAVATVGYQVDLPKADLVFKGMADTNWNVGATLEKKLLPMPFALTLSGIINHRKNQFRLGLGFILG